MAVVMSARRPPSAGPTSTWASWHYAVNRDLLAVKIEGGWSSVASVERYAHPLPAGQEGAIRLFLGWHQTGTHALPASLRA
jgi:hypothetical protein